MEILALTRDHASGPRIAGLAAPHPADDNDAPRLTLSLSDRAERADASWLLTAFLTSVASVIAEDGWAAALRRFVPSEWRSPSAVLVVVEDPGGVLGRA